MMSWATTRPLLLDGVVPLIPWLFGPLPGSVGPGSCCC